MDKIIKIIPKNIQPDKKFNEKDFTRNRKLPLPKLFVFILSIVSSGKNCGVHTKAALFFKNAKRAGIWPKASTIHRSALTKARKKLPWTVFEQKLGQAVKLAYEIWPNEKKYYWNEMNVFAIDGSKYDLPATEQLRKEFQPDSGLDIGKGHYPQALVSTLYDVFRQLPIARTIAPLYTSERDEAMKLVKHIPENSLVMFDRGYPGYEMILYLNQNYKGFYIFRSPAKSTFPAVEQFIESGKDEDIIYIEPSLEYKYKFGTKAWREARPIKLRVIKMTSPDGTVSVLLTNLFDQQKYPAQEITDLYYRRWGVEVQYRNEKTYLDVETFHGQTVNSIKQEIFAAAIMTVIALMMTVVTAETKEMGGRECQLKNAVIALAHDAAVLAPDDPDKAIEIFKELLDDISRVKYYRAQKQRPPQPRVTKRRQNKWCQYKARRLGA